MVAKKDIVMKKVLIENGHGTNTPGKRSPDNRVIEGRYAREIARRVALELEERGVPYALICPEDEDTPLRTRVYRANTLNSQYRDGTILVSLHSNAAGSDGKWHNAHGMSAHVALNASANSKTFARCLISSFESNDMCVRKCNGDREPYWSQNLCICRETRMPAVLVEMFFHDNKDDVNFATSEEGKTKIVNALVNGIMDFID